MQSSLSEMQLTEPNDIQLSSYGVIKSGADVVVLSASETGKTTNAMMHCIQKLKQPAEGSTRILYVVANNTEGLQVYETMSRMAKKNQLQIYFSSEKEDFDNDKNMISLGNDILIGTIKRLNDLFGSAGFNLNTVKLVVIDDLNEQLKNRLDTQFQRLFMSIEKTQFLINISKEDENVINFTEKFLIEPHWVEN